MQWYFPPNICSSDFLAHYSTDIEFSPRLSIDAIEGNGELGHLYVLARVIRIGNCCPVIYIFPSVIGDTETNIDRFPSSVHLPGRAPKCFRGR